MEEFTIHGLFSISNAGGYEIMISSDTTQAKVRGVQNTDFPWTSDWLDIGLVYDVDEEDWFPIIDPNGYHIPLNLVIRLT